MFIQVFWSFLFHTHNSQQRKTLREEVLSVATNAASPFSWNQGAACLNLPTREHSQEQVEHWSSAAAPATTKPSHQLWMDVLSTGLHWKGRDILIASKHCNSSLNGDVSSTMIRHEETKTPNIYKIKVLHTFSLEWGNQSKKVLSSANSNLL